MIEAEEYTQRYRVHYCILQENWSIMKPKSWEVKALSAQMSFLWTVFSFLLSFDLYPASPAPSFSLTPYIKSPSKKKKYLHHCPHTNNSCKLTHFWNITFLLSQVTTFPSWTTQQTTGLAPLLGQPCRPTAMPSCSFPNWAPIPLNSWPQISVW